MSKAVSSEWVLNVLAGMSFPGQGEAHECMQRRLKNAFPEEEKSSTVEFMSECNDNIDKLLEQLNEATC